MARGDPTRTGKKGAQPATTLIFVDEAGFQLLPTVERTYAPQGQTPVLRGPATKAHWSVISAVTLAGELFVQLQDSAFCGPDVVRFLRYLEHQVAGKLVIVWDRASIHRNAAVREFLAAGHAARIELVALPGYAPDLNPDEGVWQWLKQQLANVNCQDLPELRAVLRQKLRELRRHSELIQNFFIHAGYG